MEELLKLLKEKELTLSSIESITGGLFANSMTNMPSVSSVYLGGLITYQNDIKVKVAHVDAELIRTYGVVSKEVAIDMAIQCQNIFHSDISVSFTGNAGPTALEDKAVGLVYSAIRIHDNTYHYQDYFQGDRSLIKQQAVEAISKRLIELLRIYL